MKHSQRQYLLFYITDICDLDTPVIHSNEMHTESKVTIFCSDTFFVTMQSNAE